MNTDHMTPTNPPPVSPRRYHYAVRWPLGVAMSANTGRPMRTVHRFRSREERDEWLALGGGLIRGNNYREAVSRAEVEAEIRRSARNSPFGDGKPVWVEQSRLGEDLLS